MSQATPDSWDAVRSRVAAWIACREAVLDETAAAWVRFARAEGWSPSDVAALWDGLTEDLVRRYARPGPGAAATRARAVRGDVLAAMAALRERILGGLGP